VATRWSHHAGKRQLITDEPVPWWLKLLPSAEASQRRSKGCLCRTSTARSGYLLGHGRGGSDRARRDHTDNFPGSSVVLPSQLNCVIISYRCPDVREEHDHSLRNGCKLRAPLFPASSSHPRSIDDLVAGVLSEDAK
jgi:hypothetical protein